jgi:hypothetical protein
MKQTRLTEQEYKKILTIIKQLKILMSHKGEKYDG